jgi:hypothetical protein
MDNEDDRLALVTRVLYGEGQSRIWGGAMGSNRKWHDRKWRQSRDQKWRQSLDRTWPCPEVCSAHAQPEVATYRPSRAFWPEVTKSRDRKGPCPEVALTGSRFCACPAFSGAFFFVVVPWLPDVTKGHLTPSEFPWVCATRSCATPVVVVNNVGWGVLYDVRILYLAGLLELNTRVLYLVTGTSPGYLPLLFSYSVYIGCVVLLLC